MSRLHCYPIAIAFIATALLASAAPVAGQNKTPTKTAAKSVPETSVEIVGYVRDTRTRGGVDFAQVVIGKTSAPTHSAITDSSGRYKLIVKGHKKGSVVQLAVRRIGYHATQRDVKLVGDSVRVDFSLQVAPVQLEAVVMVSAVADAQRRSAAFSTSSVTVAASPASPAIGPVQPANEFKTKWRHAGTSAIKDDRAGGQPHDREQYDRIEDNPFLSVNGNALSTFSIDVDRASYGNMRRFITAGQAPPPDAVRIEELINYFPYAQAEPRGKDPIAITTEVAPAPWQPQHQLVRVALQARKIDVRNLPPNNLVFLIDVSGSMSSPDKLPLVKQSLRLLVSQMREQDRVALVVYAGSAGLVLPSTSGADKEIIEQAIDRLEAGGSTAGGAGILLAYRTARENFIAKGNNRVILATDGDFNVGASSDADMERLIEEKRSEGTYLTVLGFGTGNVQDAKMEKLAKKGNGNYAYVDNLEEARKTLVGEMGATLVTVANDVKLQVEFNPSTVRAYRLIGYEDRLLRNEDFIDDRKDAGDIGSGHTVTALYEIVPVGVENTVQVRETDGLRYVTNSSRRTPSAGSELMFVKLRYKQPGDSTSKLMSHAVRLDRADRIVSDDFRFAASVASFGMLLRKSEYKGSATSADVLTMARGSLGEDPGNYRAEFVRLVERWQRISTVAADRN